LPSDENSEQSGVGFDELLRRMLNTKPDAPAQRARKKASPGKQVPWRG
jgi:hypothetical protein